MGKRYLDYHGVSVLWSALKNYIASVTPSIKKLTFTGGVTAEYNGTKDVTVNIPTGGSGGTTNYSNLSNKPKINNVELSGNKTTSQLGINIPTKVSDLSNDSGFITTETDPTVPAWAKNSTKPTYTANEVGALPSTTHIPDVSDIRAAITVNPYTIEDSTPIATINGVEISAPTAGSSTVTTVQSDWNVTDTTSGAYIANKPTIPTATSDLTNDSGFLTEHQDISGKANTADLATVATSGSYTDLRNKPTIPAAVSVTNTLSSGTRVATINGTDVYAPAGGGSVTVDSALSNSSANPVQNKVINSALDNVWSKMDTLQEYIDMQHFKITKNNNVYTPNLNYDELIEQCYIRGCYANYDSKIYTPYSFGNITGLFPSSVTFCHIDFDGTNLVVEKFILTEDANQTRGCTVTYSSHTLSVSFNSSTSVLDISTE